MTTFRDILFSSFKAAGMLACSLLFFGIGWLGREATLAMPVSAKPGGSVMSNSSDRTINSARSAESLGVYRVTAYCTCVKCCGKSDGITACGYQIQPGDKLVAAPRELPFGTILTIPGYGTVKVLDRGGAIKGKRLDVYFDTHQEALNWGVKFLEITK